MMRAATAVLGAAMIGLLLALPAAAQPARDTGEFDLKIAGIKAASIRYSGLQDGSAYAVTGQIESAGLVSLIKRLRYDGAATGTVSNGQYLPSSYRESADTGKRQSDAVLDYQGGVPQIVSFAATPEPQGEAVDAATMGGSLDPLTAFYATLQAVGKGAECNLTLDIFDGRRASRLQIGPPQPAGDLIICPGAYLRLQGFTPKEMAQKSRFDVTLTLGPAESGQMQLIEVQSETIYGKAVLKRR